MMDLGLVGVGHGLHEFLAGGEREGVTVPNVLGWGVDEAHAVVVHW